MPREWFCFNFLFGTACGAIILQKPLALDGPVFSISFLDVYADTPQLWTNTKVSRCIFTFISFMCAQQSGQLYERIILFPLVGCICIFLLSTVRHLQFFHSLLTGEHTHIPLMHSHTPHTQRYLENIKYQLSEKCHNYLYKCRGDFMLQNYGFLKHAMLKFVAQLQSSNLSAAAVTVSQFCVSIVQWQCP